MVHNSPRTYTDAPLRILRWQGAGQTFTAVKTASHKLKLPLFGLRKRKAGGCVKKQAHPLEGTEKVCIFQSAIRKTL